MITFSLIGTIFLVSTVSVAWWALRAPSADQLWGTNDPEGQRLDVLLEPYGEHLGRRLVRPAEPPTPEPYRMPARSAAARGDERHRAGHRDPKLLAG